MAWRDALAEARRALPPDVVRSLRFVEPRLAHVTLKFIGETGDDAPPRLRETLDAAVPPFAIPLRLGRAGTFGPAARTQVAWLGIEGDLEGLRALAERVDAAVAEALGLPRETRPYSPHLTLARVRNSATSEERRAVAEAVAALPPPSSSAFEATRAVLVHSVLGPDGPRYRVLSHHGARGNGAV